MADATLADILLDKAASTWRAARDYGPASSSTYAQRGPAFLRPPLREAGIPEPVLDFAGRAVTLAPMALGSRGGAGPRDMYLSRLHAQKALHADDANVISGRPEVRYDFGITGGEPDPMRWGAAFDRGSLPQRSYSFSSTDLADRAPNAVADPFGAGAVRGDIPFWLKTKPANANPPRIPELTNASGGRLAQALENGGEPPRFQLETPPDLVQRYLDALRGKSNVVPFPGGRPD